MFHEEHEGHWQGVCGDWVGGRWDAGNRGAGKGYGGPKIPGLWQSRKKGSNPNGKQGRRRVLGKDDVIPLQVFGNLRVEPREELRSRGLNVSPPQPLQGGLG